MLNETIELNATLSNAVNEIHGEVATESTSIKCEVTKIGDYNGSFAFTPTDEVQVIQTNGKLLLHNITINPIPSNYGKIAWNGSTMTIT